MQSLSVTRGFGTAALAGLLVVPFVFRTAPEERFPGPEERREVTPVEHRETIDGTVLDVGAQVVSVETEQEVAKRVRVLPTAEITLNGRPAELDQISAGDWAVLELNEMDMALYVDAVTNR